MSNKTETKLNKLAVRKETISDLDVNNSGEIKGGATAQAVTANTRVCDKVAKTAVGSTCQTHVAAGCPGR